MSDNSKRPMKVLIVGGGTAGWLAANHLGKKFSASGGLSVEVTLIESPNIPNIGVGEGTVPMMRDTLRYLGIDEGDFIRQTDATFKQSIKFINWTDDPQPDNPTYYHHLFDYPKWDNSALMWLNEPAESTSYANSVSPQGYFADLGLGPKTMTHPQYQGETSYAYHLDANKFSALLSDNAVKCFGVSHILDDVTDVLVDDARQIQSVTTVNHGVLEADLYVDCTGFSARLIEQACEVPFVDKGDVLFVDTALAVQVPYEQSDTPIPCFTLSTAQEAGWIWDIGLTERRGVGYVYSSRHSTQAEAEQVLRKYLGTTGDKLALRKIEMRIGYRERAWHQNCVAIGLSAGFVEPLEATGLLVFDVTSRMLAECFPAHRDAMPLVAEQFNRRITHTWDKVIDFIKLHYVASKRSDSQFWLDNRQTSSIPESLQQKLALWRYQLPSRYEFASTMEIFNLENYLYVLYGMDFDTDIAPWTVTDAQQSQYQAQQAQLLQYVQAARKQLLPHRELIARIKQYGISKV
ncbi:tryptophan halogenase family protein [Shewanella colwelliana]|uniref:tryptophan halogenase family protein n=1 Tax=Shewanella colwelliana TaxID=23 RepID=UPI0022AE7715|nr:tryptophan halogenase family protein [Shewanella colwelliana]MCZ4336277.1 tryptophan 7-halogenase [Shewanella colwelliana]